MLPLVLALLLSGTPRPSPLRAPHIRSSGGLSHTLPSSGGSTVALSFLPSNGIGAPVVGDLCDSFPGELTGNWVCLKGTGLVKSGSQTVTAVGSPASISPSLCPNGLYCGAVSEQRLNGTADAFTSSVAGPTGDWSLCSTFRLDGASGILAGRDNGNVTQRGVELDVSATGGGTFALIYTASGGSSCNAGSGVVIPGAETFICLTYQHVSSGADNVAKLYINGVQSSTTTSTCPAMTSTAPWFFGTRSDTYFPGWMPGTLRNAMVTEKVLSAATIAAMAHTVLADTPTGTHGETLTFSRASVKICDPADGGALSVLPTDRPCIANGINIEGPATNLVLQNRDLSNAAWTKTNATCARTATDMSGVTSAASTCTATAGNATVLQTVTTAAATRSASMDIRRHPGGGTGPINVSRDNGSTWTVVTLTSAFQRFTPDNTAALSSGGANPTIGIRIVTNGDSIDVDYVQDEAGAFATSRIVTAGTSVTRALDAASLPAQSVLASTFSISERVTAPVASLTGYYWDNRNGSARGQALLAGGTAGNTQLFTTDGTTTLGATSGALTWTAGTTYKISATKVGTTITTYRDGVSTATASPSATTLPADGVLWLGRNASGNQFVSGSIKDVCVSGTAAGCAP